MIVNITCGEEFNQYISNIQNGIFIPFNEVLIEGNPLYPLFSIDFIKERCKCHNVSMKLYKSKINLFLDTINSIDKNVDLILWFGKDTFCQINLLGILTYFEQIKCTNRIFLNIIDEETNEILENEIPIYLGTFTDSYKNLFEQNIFLKTNFTYLDNAIKEYVELNNPDNDIYIFIKENRNKLTRKELFNSVFDATRKYGLGDIQVNNMIDNVYK